MTETLQEWKDRLIDDLRVIKSEEFVDEDSKTCCCIYSFSLDAVTFVDNEVIQLLQERGIKELDKLPE
ncbi:MAG: hypothetical protein V7K53_29405 [Nostoc sp.]|uniref:hypothetical protein n=1 Tax=Nostoc sp. TaxID=1180 RepID=UPI002FFD23C6